MPDHRYLGVLPCRSSFDRAGSSATLTPGGFGPGYLLSSWYVQSRGR